MNTEHAGSSDQETSSPLGPPPFFHGSVQGIIGGISGFVPGLFGAYAFDQGSSSFGRVLLYVSGATAGILLGVLGGILGWKIGLFFGNPRKRRVDDETLFSACFLGFVLVGAVTGGIAGWIRDGEKTIAMGLLWGVLLSSLCRAIPAIFEHFWTKFGLASAVGVTIGSALGVAVGTIGWIAINTVLWLLSGVFLPGTIEFSACFFGIIGAILGFGITRKLKK